MDSNVFRNYIEKYHREWLSRAINIPASKSIGIDLFDSDVGIEMKCRLDTYATNYPVHAYQVQQFERDNPEKKLFWGFLSYTLTKPVSDIKQKENLSELISHIEVRILEWDWVKQFPISSPKTGPYIYIHSKDFPSKDSFVRYEKNNGVIYLPHNSIIENKIHNKTAISTFSMEAPF